MRGLITIILIVVIAFFVVPMAAEGTVDSCKALERHVVSAQAAKIAGGNTDSTTYNTVNSTGQAAANGQVATTLMEQNHPSTPTPISCTYFWWKSLFQ